MNKILILKAALAYQRDRRVFAAGQVGTPYTCALCGKEKVHDNTSIPIFCKKCVYDIQKMNLQKEKD